MQTAQITKELSSTARSLKGKLKRGVLNLPEIEGFLTRVENANTLPSKKPRAAKFTCDKLK
jgi:hypothetical protein